MYRNCGSQSTPSSEDRTYPIKTLVRRGFELRASRPELLQYALGARCSAGGAPGSPEPEPRLGGRLQLNGTGRTYVQKGRFGFDVMCMASHGEAVTLEF